MHETWLIVFYILKYLDSKAQQKASSVYSLLFWNWPCIIILILQCNQHEQNFSHCRLLVIWSRRTCQCTKLIYRELHFIVILELFHFLNFVQGACYLCQMAMSLNLTFICSITRCKVIITYFGDIATAESSRAWGDIINEHSTWET